METFLFPRTTSYHVHDTALLRQKGPLRYVPVALDSNLKPVLDPDSELADFVRNESKFRSGFVRRSDP